MTLALVVAVLAVVVVVATGRTAGLTALPVRAVRLLVAAGVLQVGATSVAAGSAWVRVPVLVLAVLLVALFLAGNSTLPGIPLIAVGLLLNVLVITANGAMPVSVAAAARAGVSAPELVADDALRVPVGAGTRMGLLGDQIPVALPWWPQVVSLGDVLVAAGVGLLLVAGSRLKPGAQAPSLVERSMILDRYSTTRGSYS